MQATLSFVSKHVSPLGLLYSFVHRAAQGLPAPAQAPDRTLSKVYTTSFARRQRPRQRFKNPEMLNHPKSEALSLKTITAAALRKVTPSLAWAACLAWLRRATADGELTTTTNLPPEWPDAEQIRAMCHCP